MITLYQESVPFSNKMFEGKISQDKKYTNPVIIPYAANSTLGENVLETVIYIKNDDQSRYYQNVVISLMKEVGDTPVAADGSLIFTENELTFSLGSNLDIPVDEAYTYPGARPTGSVTIAGSYMSTYVPVTTSSSETVKFSYGYDEISSIKWSEKNSILLIPTIGTNGLGDTSYIPIRMRLSLSDKIPFVTNRNYFIDISYSREGVVGDGGA